MTVVLIYLRRSKLVESMRLSIKPARKNIIGATCFVVIGDRPLAGDVEFIDCSKLISAQHKKITGLDLQKFGSKQIDIAHKKTLLAIDSKKISDSLVRMYDDHFVRRPTTIEELSISRTAGRTESAQAAVAVAGDQATNVCSAARGWLNDERFFMSPHSCF